MHDMNEILAAAIFVEEHPGLYPHGSPIQKLAAFVRDITDETPLTVEALVRELGNGHVGGIAKADGVTITLPYADPKTWCWFSTTKDGWSICPIPRTVGDLRRLLYQLQRDGGK